MADTNNLTLGNGTLYVDGVDVGYLSGNVEIQFSREIVNFKPSNALGPVKRFIRGESMLLRAELAELKCANMRLAMGINEALTESSSYPAYEGAPSGGSYSPPDSASYDVLNIGGSKTLSEMPVRFVHTRPDGQDVIVVLYNASVTPDITIPFNDTDVTVHGIEFQALHVTSRAEGDQLGFIADQVQGS